MRHTARILQSLERQVVRAKSTAFIGLGRMGSEMAFNLFSKTFAESPDTRFVVCDALPTSAVAFQQNFVTQFPGAHIDIVLTPKEAVHASQTVLTMLPSSPQVTAVYSEANGVMSALKSLSAAELARSLFIDSTTLDVGIARNVAAEVISAGAQMVDAPVSGGVTGAKAGTLAFLVGGTQGAFELSQPILTHMGNRIIHCGPSGAGLGAKICNNLVLGVQQIVVGEAMLLGQKLGLDPRILAGVINSSTGGCWASSVNNPVPYSLADKSPPCERNYEGGFATALMLKDMLLATDVAASTDSPLPLGKCAQQFYAETLRHRPDLAQKDFSSVYERLEQMRRENQRDHADLPIVFIL